MGEEQHLVGSERYVKHVPEEQRQCIKAMINMDTLGLGTTEVWVTHADTTLDRVFGAVATSMQIPVRAMNVDKVGTTDSEPFARLQVPRMTIYTLTGETLPILHSSKDRLDKVRMGDYYDTYRLVAGYLIYLDGYLGQENRQPASAPAVAH
jgi:Zn-dependent M28 family amino/carboxypeptidase